MAKGNLILGTMSGKLGDVVAYNYNGKQAARVRRRTIANPKSAKQAIQRAIAATVAKFVSAFAPVLNNSLQSEQTKVKTLAKIRGLNMNMLRQLAAAGDGTYCPKGAMYVAPNNYIISRGSLPGLAPIASEYTKLNSGLLVFKDTDIFVDDPTDTAATAFPSIAVGDQITIMVAGLEDIAEGSLVAYCRFAFKDNTTPAWLSEDNKFRLNPDAIDLAKAEGPWDKLVFITNSPESTTSVNVAELIGLTGVTVAGVIVSREAGKLRSNASMLSSADSDYSLAKVYPTYMDGGTPIDMPSENYLDNDADATIYFAHLPSSVPYTVTLPEDARRLFKLSTNVPLDNGTNLNLTIRRDDNSVTLRLAYNGPVVSSSDISVEAQWLANGYLALAGNSGNINITEGNISFSGGTVQLD